MEAVILDLLAKLRDEFAMTYFFVSHDLAVVRRVCERVLVMRSGKIVESGMTKAVLTAPIIPTPRSSSRRFLVRHTELFKMPRALRIARSSARARELFAKFALGTSTPSPDIGGAPDRVQQQLYTVSRCRRCDQRRRTALAVPAAFIAAGIFSIVD